MFCAYIRPGYQVSVYRNIGPLFVCFFHLSLSYVLYTSSPENPYFVGELILPYLMANDIFTVTNFHRTYTNKFQLCYRSKTLH